MRGLWMLSGVLMFAGPAAAVDEAVARRQQYLEQVQRLLPESKPWSAWLAESGELPPDFEAFPSIPGLPDPLIGPDGQRVTTPGTWARQREALKALFAQWIMGSAPPAPDHVEAAVLDERREAGCTVREVELRFGPDGKARLWCEVMIPEGNGPFPVFLTQHNHRAWALIALQRGYLACVYAGADTRDDTDSFLEAYPGYDWSRLTRRAWAAGRCVDYLEEVPQADARRIAITGHSRNGKQALMAAALDERIAIVISSSSGAGGSMPTRLYGEQQYGEGIEMITRSFPEWFHPRWRFFTGREDRLPLDLHELAALSAPRPCLISTALNDDVESVWAGEQAYHAVRPVYRLFGAEDRLRILYRPGGHETWPTVIERYLDWCDLHFGRGEYAFPERLIYPHDWGAWRAKSRTAPDPQAFPARGADDVLANPDGTQIDNREDWNRRREEIRGHVRAMLGAAPPRAVNPGGDYGKEPPHVEALLDRAAPGTRLQRQDLVFGEYINADVYAPRELDLESAQAPAVLWLHPISCSQGYVMGYKRGENAFAEIARAGFVVFCYDQTGFGRRIEEVEGFYTRYPDWSLLGKMVRDAQAALDAILALPYVAKDKVHIAGYGLGAMVGLHLCALDERPAGLLALSPPPPMRLAGEGGGVYRWSRDWLLAPQLGCFLGHEDRIPYDVPDLVAACAPRPVALVTAALDWESPPALAARAVAAARPAYALFDAERALEQLTPGDYNRFGPEMQAVATAWLRGRT